MAESDNRTRLLNPCVLLLQKMGLELKCPMCLNLFSGPLLLPCNHIICSSCVSSAMESNLHCPVCKTPHIFQDLKPAAHIENLANIYKSMEAAFGALLIKLKPEVDLLVTKPMDLNHIMDSIITGNPEPIDLNHLQNSRVTCNLGKSRRGSTQSIYLPHFRAQGGIEIRPESPDSLCKARDAEETCEVARLDVPRACKEASANDIFCFRNLHSKGEGNLEKNANHMEQSSRDSPPPFADTKDSDDDSNNHGNGHGAKRVPGEGNATMKPKFEKDEEANVILTSSFYNDTLATEFEVLEKLDANSRRRASLAENDPPRESKRQKITPGNNDLPSNTHHLNAKQAAAVCAFCQTSNDSEFTQAMLHYVNGKPIFVDQATHSNVVHVHKRCAEWAPQIYFDGERAMNLEAEIARGAKIKCTSCGRKGAALGCYAKSCRRSYHMPCAVHIDECRWDNDNYLMFCPTHASFKFPSEKSKSGSKIKAKCATSPIASSNSLQDFPSTTLNPDKLWTSPGKSEWVLCGSALSPVEKDLVAKFARLAKATVTKSWDPSVTHVIASTDDNGACSRTLKFLMGILNGKWILKVDWIKACMEAKHPVQEEPYEIRCDIYGCCNGPQNGRMRIIEKAPKLFGGIDFYLAGEFESSYKGYLEDLIVAAGGLVLENKADISKTEARLATTIIIYSLDPPEGCNSEQLPSVIEQRLEEADAIASTTGAWVSGHTWLLDSIAACKLLPVVS